MEGKTIAVDQGRSHVRQQMRASDVYYLEFTNADTGSIEHKRIVGAKIAQAIARSTAIATGRRVIVRRQPPSDGWKVLVWDSETGKVLPVQTGLCGKVARMAHRKFPDAEIRAVMLLWPDWAPVPKAVVA